jgi:hypothetical protein
MPGEMKQNSLSRSSASKYVALCFIVVTAIVLRALYLDSPIRYDEAFSYLNFIRHPFYSIITDYSYPNNHVLYSLFSKMTVVVLGASRYTVRLTACFAGVGVIFCGYFLFSKLYDEATSFLIAFGLAVLPIMVDMSVNGRGYSMLVLFFLVSVLSMTCWIHSNSRKWLIYTIIFFAMGLYTIPIMIFYAPLLFAISFCYRSLEGYIGWLKQVTFIIVSSALLAMLFYLPLVCSSGISSLFANSFVKPAPSLSSVFKGFIWLFDYLTITSSFVEKLILAIGIVGSLFGSYFGSKNRYILGSIILTVIALEITFGSKLQPRFLYMFTPFIFGVSCSGLMNIGRFSLRFSDMTIALILVTISFAIILASWGRCFQSIRDPIDDILPDANRFIGVLMNGRLGTKVVLTRDRLHVPLAFEQSLAGSSGNMICSDISEVKTITGGNDFDLLLVSDEIFARRCLVENRSNCQDIKEIECIVNNCFSANREQGLVRCSNVNRIDSPGFEAWVSSCHFG